MGRDKYTLQNRVITPEMAKAMLKSGHPNRPLIEQKARAYAMQMKQGRWVVSQPILLSDENRLMDGQTRLRAVVIADIPVRFLVLSGYDFEETFPFLDRGKIRNPGQIIYTDREWRGELNGAECGRIAAALVYQWRVDRGHDPCYRGIADPTADEVLDLAHQHDGYHHSVRCVGRKARSLMRPGMAVFLHYQFALRDKLLADAFLEDLGSGEGLSGGDALYILRERLLSDRAKESKSRLKKEEVMALTIKAWNAERAGIRVRTLRWRRSGAKVEPFPKIE